MRSILILIFLLASTSLAQIDAKVEYATSLVGVANPRMVGTSIVVNADSNPKLVPIAIVRLETDYDYVDYEAINNGEDVDLQTIDARTFVVNHVGKTRIKFTAFDASKQIKIVKKRIDVELGKQPDPPPGPGPGPEPPPAPNPAPIPGDGVRVLVVYEIDDVAKYTPGQNSIMFGASMRNFLAQTCVKGVGNTPEFRIFDKDTVVESGVWKEAMKRERKSLPWIIVSNGKTGFEGPLPQTEAEAQTLIKGLAK